MMRSNFYFTLSKLKSSKEVFAELEKVGLNKKTAAHALAKLGADTLKEIGFDKHVVADLLAGVKVRAKTKK